MKNYCLRFKVTLQILKVILFFFLSWFVFNEASWINQDDFVSCCFSDRFWWLWCIAILVKFPNSSISSCFHNVTWQQLNIKECIDMVLNVFVFHLNICCSRGKIVLLLALFISQCQKQRALDVYYIDVVFILEFRSMFKYSTQIKTDLLSAYSLLNVCLTNRQERNIYLFIIFDWGLFHSFCTKR